MGFTALIFYISFIHIKYFWAIMYITAVWYDSYLILQWNKYNNTWLFQYRHWYLTSVHQFSPLTMGRGKILSHLGQTPRPILNTLSIYLIYFGPFTQYDLLAYVTLELFIIEIIILVCFCFLHKMYSSSEVHGAINVHIVIFPYFISVLDTSHQAYTLP